MSMPYVLLVVSWDNDHNRDHRISTHRFATEAAAYQASKFLDSAGRNLVMTVIKDGSGEAKPPQQPSKERSMRSKRAWVTRKANAAAKSAGVAKAARGFFGNGTDG